MTFFRLEYRTDVLDPDHLLVRVQVDNPVTAGIKRATVETEIRIKGIDIADGYPEWPAPFWQTDSHRKRNDDSRTFCMGNPKEHRGLVVSQPRRTQRLHVG